MTNWKAECTQDKYKIEFESDNYDMYECVLKACLQTKDNTSSCDNIMYHNNNITSQTDTYWREYLLNLGCTVNLKELCRKYNYYYVGSDYAILLNDQLMFVGDIAPGQPYDIIFECVDLDTYKVIKHNQRLYKE